MKVHVHVLWNFPGYHYTFSYSFSFFYFCSFWHHIATPKMNFQCLDWDCCKDYNVDEVNKYVRSHVDLPFSFHWKFYWSNIAVLVFTENDKPTTLIPSCYSCRFHDVIRLQSIHWGTLEENLFTTTKGSHDFVVTARGSCVKWPLGYITSTTTPPLNWVNGGPSVNYIS